MGELVAGRASTETPVLVGWGALWLAIATNVSQVFLLDSSDGLRDPALLAPAVGSFLAELWLFGRAVRCLSPVIAYAVYGTTPAFVTILSVTFFSETLTLAKVAGVAIVTAGIILLATAGRAPARTGCAENVAAPSVPHTGTGDDPAPAAATEDAFAVR
jgi:small multidrug resistance pump